MKCINCGGGYAKEVVLYEGEEPQVLCKKCLSILQSLEQQLLDTLSEET